MKKPNSIDRHFYIVLALFIACTVIYYFGELVNFFGWEILRWNIWYTVHDPHRILFLVPILYCSYYYGLRGALLSNVVSLLIFLPRALFISPYPDATLRMIIFVIASTALSTLLALLLTNRSKDIEFHDRVRPAPEKYPKIPRMLLLIFIFMSAGILISGYVFFNDYEKNYRTQVERQLSAIGDLKAGEVVQWRKERIGDANLLFRNPAFSGLVQRYLEHPDDAEPQEQLKSWLSHYLGYGQYEKILLLDTHGVVRIAIPDISEPIARHIAQDAAKVLQSGKVTMLDLDRDEDTLPPHMSMLTPIYREKDDGVPLGVVALVIDPYRYLYPLISRWPTSSATAETLIVRRDGNDALFLNELKFQKDSELNLRIPLEQKDVPAVRAILGEEGIVEGNDYHGERVIADIRQIPDSPWFMVARVDTSEVYSPLTQMLWLIITLIGSLLIGAGTGVGLVWRQQNIRVYKERAEIADALRESEEKHRLIIDYSLDMIYTLDADGKFLFVSPASQRIMGYDPSEMLGRTIRSFIHPDDVPVVENALMDFLETGQFTPGLEYRVKHSSGDWRWHTTSGNRVLDETGSFLYFVGIAHDITERREAEIRIQESEILYRTLIEISPDAIGLMGMNGSIITINKRALEVFGFEPTEDLRGRNIMDFVAPENFDSVAENMEKLQKSNVLRNWEITSFKKDGSPFFLELSSSMLLDEAGKPKSVMTVFKDVTERKLAEEKLARLHQQNELILGTVAEGIMELDLRGNHVYVNPAAAKMLGYEVGELLHHPSHSTWHHTRADGSPYPQEECAIYAAYRDGLIHHVDTEVFWRKDGTSFPTEYTSTPSYEQGRLVGAVVTFADITERKLSEEKLLKSYESVKKTLKDAIDTMVKIVEMRDPYTAGHQQRVADLATNIARGMKLEDTRIDNLRTAAVIHDIGKMYIPSDILSKPGRLSEIEFSLIKTHAQSGYDIVKGMDLPVVVAQAILQHHERLDGSGYPNQLRGKDTLLEAKILAVADVIEAMAADRPYRPALGIKMALEEISKNRGRLYDPDVVDTCLELFNSGRFEFKPV